ncbi:5-formyltetrahydrofolate cyclo-ligase [Phycicoccus sp. CSK15P-2]|uniref:5-formyltetrahydrofolate cyclo-ligase n=1 Tax=Phycicoccus sp. CSK15P-2 TaxID=2807627 RepID=UPI001EF1679E|nr:5-formyltetrahydrofolate cyclo-ligase [Phycicoccus sp. CSK15P-2]
MSVPGIPKRSRRASARARRRELAGRRDRVVDSTALARGGLALVDDLGLGPGHTVTSYESLPVEPPTEALNTALVAAGMRVLVPLTLPDFDLDWADVRDPDREPLGLDAVGSASLVLAPGLGVDGAGTRLGQGGGCYDRALLRAPGVPVVVLLHPGELLGAADQPLPREPHDVPVSGVLTADGYVGLPVTA